MNKKSFNLEFWEMDYRKRFQLDREGEEILHFLVKVNPNLAKQFIKDKYERNVYRGDIIDTYCDKYDNLKINKLLNDLDFESLTQEEIIECGIKVNNESEEELE